LPSLGDFRKAPLVLGATCFPMRPSAGSGRTFASRRWPAAITRILRQGCSAVTSSTRRVRMSPRFRNASS